MMDNGENVEVKSGREPTLFETLTIIAIAAILIILSVRYWKTDVHISLVLSGAITAAMAMFILKYPWKVIEEGALGSIFMGMQAILILLTVGILIGTWILSGVVQTMIYYGLETLKPSVFLVATLLICSIVSLSTGTSWGTSGTVGVALMGIAAGLDIPSPVAAGFIVSGAYFGDKMSPLSDTTNLAPAMAGTDIFQHIRAMFWTTGPTYVIVLLLAAILGMGYAPESLDAEKVQAIQALMKVEFPISPIALIPPILVIVLAASGKPALPSIFSGVLAGMALAIFHGNSFGTLFDVMQNGYTPNLPAQIVKLSEDLPGLTNLMVERGLDSFSTDSILNAASVLSELLARGGLLSMTWTVALIICALLFGGVLDKCGFLKSLLQVIMKRVRTVGGCVVAVAVASLTTNVIASDQYLALVLPGRMFKKTFDDQGLHPRMLSRTLEDIGTLTSALVPWNTCGAYQSTTLGVSTMDYLPYAFLNYLNPLIAIAMTYMGIGTAWKGKDGKPIIAKTKPADL
ncbi:MAG: Na+/H+ antiporter NhaC [Synergistaceae bacterium]|jgi:NhaC family Na+:H+ antiporter|nr:Na+/H+ antiporter NhaC [Synergistaceae bacterium]